MNSVDLQMLDCVLTDALLEILQEHDLEAIKDIIACLEIVREELEQ